MISQGKYLSLDDLKFVSANSVRKCIEKERKCFHSVAFFYVSEMTNDFPEIFSIIWQGPKMLHMLSKTSAVDDLFSELRRNSK